jgi:hypothetical protein
VREVVVSRQRWREADGTAAWRSAPGPPDVPDVAAWRAVSHDTPWIPARFATYDVPLAEAAARLRVPPGHLRASTEVGMPFAGGDADPAFDACDLFNLGLAARRGRAMPVVAFRRALRWLGRGTDDLLAPTSWRCRFGGAEEALTLRAPAVEPWAGRWAPDASAGDDASWAVGDRVPLPAGVRLHGTATLVGRRAPVVAPEIRAAVRRELASGRRWAKLPFAMQVEEGAADPLGYATCVTASERVGAELRRAGAEVRTRRGWLAGPVASGHTWLEVRDEDDEWKAVDLALATLRARLDDVEGRPPAPSAALEALALGLRPNRLVPTTAGGTDPLASTSGGHAAETVATFSVDASPASRPAPPSEPPKDHR